jgi:hypothetical protein
MATSLLMPHLILASPIRGSADQRLSCTAMTQMFQPLRWATVRAGKCDRGLAPSSRPSLHHRRTTSEAIVYGTRLVTRTSYACRMVRHADAAGDGISRTEHLLRVKLSWLELAIRTALRYDTLSQFAVSASVCSGTTSRLLSIRKRGMHHGGIVRVSGEQRTGLVCICCHDRACPSRSQWSLCPAILLR